MNISDIFSFLLLIAYLPVQIGFLVLGILLIKRAAGSKKKIALGILSIVAFLAMLPFSPIAFALVFLLITGGSFGP